VLPEQVMPSTRAQAPCCYTYSGSHARAGRGKTLLKTARDWKTLEKSYAQRRTQGKAEKG